MVHLCFLWLTFAHSHRDDHWDVVFVTSIFVAVRGDEISLFKLYRYEDVSSCRDGEHEMGDRHCRCRPESKQPAEI